jgi:hypothetical protein
MPEHRQDDAFDAAYRERLTARPVMSPPEAGPRTAAPTGV